LYRTIKDVTGMDIAAIRRLSASGAADLLDRLQNPRRTASTAARWESRRSGRASQRGSPRAVGFEDAARSGFELLPSELE
jgi:hypothetical protein